MDGRRFHVTYSNDCRVIYQHPKPETKEEIEDAQGFEHLPSVVTWLCSPLTRQHTAASRVIEAARLLHMSAPRTTAPGTDSALQMCEGEREASLVEALSAVSRQWRQSSQGHKIMCAQSSKAGGSKGRGALFKRRPEQLSDSQRRQERLVASMRKAAERREAARLKVRERRAKLIAEEQLLVAAKTNNVEWARECLDKGAGVSRYRRSGVDVGAGSLDGRRGWSALHFACSHNAPEVVALLCEKGADVNLVFPKDGRTPIFWACSNNNVDVAKILISHKADVNHAARSHGRGSASPPKVLALPPARDEAGRWTARGRERCVDEAAGSGEPLESKRRSCEMCKKVRVYIVVCMVSSLSQGRYLSLRVSVTIVAAVS